MGTESFKIVIPARYASSRFPGKALHPLNGRPMILHVVDRARESAAKQIVVATDDERIADVCRDANVLVQMTSVHHRSGTDRIAEVAKQLGWPDSTVLVGLQGDEPATPAAHLNLLASNLHAHPMADMATLCVPVRSISDYQNSDRVKVVCDTQGMALYFSRAPIPCRRAGLCDGKFPASFIHVGLYAYRCAYLHRYGELTPAPAELEEQLEQLRVLHHGGRIHVAVVAATQVHGVDRQIDVADVEKALQQLGR